MQQPQPQPLQRLPPGVIPERPWTPDRVLYAWASRRANRLLRSADAPKVSEIPAELWGIIAEFLAWDDGIHTLPSLNRANREIHEGTLPVLYETVWLEDEAAFTRCIGEKNLPGFKYTKYLFANDLTIPLLRMHQRYQSLLNHTTPTSTFTDLFPKLVMLARTLPDPTGHQFPRPHPRTQCSPLSITLFKPITLDSVKRVCTPAMLGQDVATSFFGGYVSPAGARWERPENLMVRDIVGLTLETGAALRESGETKMGDVKPTRESPRFVLTVADGAREVEDSLKVVLAYLKAFAGSKEVIMRGKWVRVRLDCGAEVLEKFTELFREVQPLFLALDIHLSGPTTRQQIQHHLTSLADVYTPHWTHHISVPGANFIHILTPAPAFHQFDILDRAGDGDFLGPLTSEHAGGWIATLSAGYDDPDPLEGLAGGDPDDPMHHHGFTARISETLLWRGREEGDPRPIWEHVYPMRHVPVPAADPEGEDAPRWVDEFAGEFRLMQYEQRLRRPRRLTEETAARLRVAGYEVPPVPVQAQVQNRAGRREQVAGVGVVGVAAPVPGGAAPGAAAAPPGGER